MINLTESLNIIQELGLINFIAQKHGNIDPSHPVKGIPEKTKITVYGLRKLCKEST